MIIGRKKEKEKKQTCPVGLGHQHDQILHTNDERDKALLQPHPQTTHMQVSKTLE
jgi:hypothetical protein